MKKYIGDFRIRKAGIEDSALVLNFITGLAEYERLLDQVTATEENIREFVFEKQYSEVILAELDGKPVGFALFYHNFSTFQGLPGIYLEDVFVKPEYRGFGFGKSLLAYLAKLALERRCGRLVWSCLVWNEPSIRFYKSLGAECQDEWRTYRLTGESIEKLASEYMSGVEK